MKERPILFSAPMVRAILGGRKTQTRRVCNPQPVYLAGGGRRVYADPDFKKAWRHLPGCNWSLDPYVDCPYGQPGDRLWVRETWRHRCDQKELFDCIEYRADGAMRKPDFNGPWENTDHNTWPRFSDRCEMSEEVGGEAWRPSIHIPRWAARITLEITCIRAERLQEISAADALAEGIFKCPSGRWEAPLVQAKAGTICMEVDDPRVAYRALWEQINGPGSWDSNPWVWVVTFGRLS